MLAVAINERRDYVGHTVNEARTVHSQQHDEQASQRYYGSEHRARGSPRPVKHVNGNGRAVLPLVQSTPICPRNLRGMASSLKTRVTPR
jgi:hypothetical protein